VSNFGTNPKFPVEKRNLMPKLIEINITKKNLPAELISKQAQHLLDIVRKTNVGFECSENDERNKFTVTLQGNIDRDNLHIYLEEGYLVIETRKDAKDKIVFKTMDWGEISVKERSILYVRHAIHLPTDAEASTVKTQSLAEVVVVEVPKLVGKLEST
jgi:HSP20 family molecular chaperone IbpA